MKERYDSTNIHMDIVAMAVTQPTALRIAFKLVSAWCSALGRHSHSCTGRDINGLPGELVQEEIALG